MKNRVLNSNRSIVLEVSVASVSGLLIVMYLVWDQMDTLVAIMWGSVFVVSASMYWILYSSKPAAWAADGKVCLKTWPFKIVSIDKKKVESIKYVTGVPITGRHGKREIHQILINMNGYDTWTIPITDRVDHINDLRLYQFLKDEFGEVEVSNKPLLAPR